MHIALYHVIEPGDLYYVAFPKWWGTFRTSDDPSFDWHKTSVIQVNPTIPYDPTRAWYDPAGGIPRYKRINKVPLGSMAFVLRAPGEGADAREVSRAFDTKPEREVLCMVTNAETGQSFLACVGVSELWEQDPRVERFYPRERFYPKEDKHEARR